MLAFSSKRKKKSLQTERKSERELRRGVGEVCGSSPRCTNFFHPTVYHPPPPPPRPETRSRFIPTTPYTIHVCYRGGERRGGTLTTASTLAAAINQPLPPLLPRSFLFFALFFFFFPLGSRAASLERVGELDRAREPRRVHHLSGKWILFFGVNVFLSFSVSVSASFFACLSSSGGWISTRHAIGRKEEEGGVLSFNGKRQIHDFGGSILEDTCRLYTWS